MWERTADRAHCEFGGHVIHSHARGSKPLRLLFVQSTPNIPRIITLRDVYYD